MPKNKSAWLKWVEGKKPETIASRLLLLERLTEIDQLSGLYNVRGWDEEIRRLVAIADRQKKPTSFLIIDLDNFKQVNDRWGHKVGNKIITHMADLLKTHLRLSDVIARIGGDEFGIILPFTDALGANEVAQKIVPDKYLVHYGVGLSVGVSTKNLEETSETAIARADKKMYKVKKSKK